MGGFSLNRCVNVLNAYLRENRTMEIKDENVFTTRDFYISAFLLTKGYRLESVNRENPRQIFFIFNDFEARESLVRDFVFGKASVEPQAFIEKIKALKQLIYSND